MAFIILFINRIDLVCLSYKSYQFQYLKNILYCNIIKLKMTRQQLLTSSFQYKQQDPDYKGQQLDEQYGHGPVESRSCTDIFCCFLFLIFLVGTAIIAYIGFTTGNPKYLASPFDASGKQCYYDEGYQQYQKIFITDLKSDPTQITFVCVKQCPTSSNDTIICKQNNITTCDNLRPYNSKTLVNICLPIDQDIIDQISDFLDLGILQQYFSDMQTTWPLILGMFGFSLIYSLIYTILMRLFAKCFIWTFIFIFIVFHLVIGILSFLIPFVKPIQDIIHYNDLPQNLRNRDYQIAMGVICCFLGTITLLLVCCMRRQITISIGILKAAADFSRQQCSALLLPLLGVILQIIFVAFWVTVMLFLFSSNDDIDPIPQTPFASIVFNQNIQRYTIYYIFVLLWMINFISGLSSYWVASTVAIWYFQQGQPRNPILKSLLRSILNIGSIAFGSLLIAIVMFIRILLEGLNNKLKTQTLGMEEKIGVTKFLLSCASCLIACFERIIRFITQNAYIMMAISGKNFCTSAKEAFYVMLRSSGQYAVSYGTTKIFIGLGKTLIISLSVFTGYLLLTSIQYFKVSVYSPVFVTIIFIISSYPVASGFMQFFETAANTLLICYCVQLDLMRGNNPKCPQALRKFLQNYVSSISSLSEIQ